MKEIEKRLALIASGFFFLYFGWLFWTTGILTANRGRYVVTAAEEPERFSYSVGLVVVLGIVSLIGGMFLRR
jgi:hypothetical protein